MYEPLEHMSEEGSPRSRPVSIKLRLTEYESDQGEEGYPSFLRKCLLCKEERDWANDPGDLEESQDLHFNKCKDGSKTRRAVDDGERSKVSRILDGRYEEVGSDDHGNCLFRNEEYLS